MYQLFIYLNILFIFLFIKKNNSFNENEEKYEEIKLENVQIKVREWQSELGNFTIPSEKNEKYSKGIRLEEKLAINLQFNIIDKNTKKLIDGIQQKFLRLWHSKTKEHEVFFIGKRVTINNGGGEGKYFIEIVAMPKDTHKFGGRPGRYHCELIIGDIRIKNPFRWHLIDVFVDIPKHRKLFMNEPATYTPRDRSPKTKLLPELSHKFKEINKCNLNWSTKFFIFYAFLCFSPLLLLIIQFITLFI
uniref:Dolichyl-diphosphooligosaccharide--protein glycosyltransferase subunit 2 n=1 Tax=Meloidogyne enterolobii TaxID=390850 RepID=A0A6V7UT43_MELEN|nr:unnamed protein product [Meloidogyne enterolobii]